MFRGDGMGGGRIVGRRVVGDEIKNGEKMTQFFSLLYNRL